MRFIFAVKEIVSSDAHLNEKGNLLPKSGRSVELCFHRSLLNSSFFISGREREGGKSRSHLFPFETKKGEVVKTKQKFTG